MVKATVSGERFDPERHESRVLVKAITYHGMRIYQEGGLYVVEYTPDI
jgi:SHS2 domain-containing protein